MARDFPLDLKSLQSVLDYLNLGVYITDRDRRIMLWNRKAEEITGYKSADVVGRCCRESILCHVDKEGHLLCATHLCPLFRAMETDTASRQPSLVFAQKASGKRVATSVTVAPLRNEEGEVIGGIESFQDESANISDMEFARKIQRHIMPAALPANDSLKFDVRYYPHDLVGGDFYDVTDLGDGRFSIVVADVRGHGVSAALYTTVLKTIDDSLAHLAHDPAEFLTALNRELTRLVVDESFATAVCAVVDTRDYRVLLASAGHPPALHYQAAHSQVHEVETFGLPLGIDADEKYDSIAFYLMSGDTLLFYTDGITDITGKDKKPIGAKGLAALLRQSISRPKSDLLEDIYLDAVESNAEVSVADDILLLSASRN